MKHFIYSIPINIVKCFSKKNLLWHFLMIITTYGIVASGFDWLYFKSSHNQTLQAFLFPAVIIGGLIPIVIPIFLLIIGKIRKNSTTVNTGFALGQAAFLGWFISSLYKAFTGRIPPSFTNLITDISKEFQFGFLEGGIFWGWPSSHTTIAFAMATTLIILYPKRKNILSFAIAYALYIGFGISISIHWFSEFIAGAILGTIIGLVVGKSFKPLIKN